MYASNSCSINRCFFLFPRQICAPTTVDVFFFDIVVVIGACRFFPFGVLLRHCIFFLVAFNKTVSNSPHFFVETEKWVCLPMCVCVCGVSYKIDLNMQKCLRHIVYYYASAVYAVILITNSQVTWLVWSYDANLFFGWNTQNTCSRFSIFILTAHSEWLSDQEIERERGRKAHGYGRFQTFYALRVVNFIATHTHCQRYRKI